MPLASGIVESYLATAAAVAPLLRTPELADRWDQPSALAEMSVSGLAGHLARSVFNVERHLDTPLLEGLEPLNVVSYYVGGGDPDAPLDDPAKVRIRAVSEQEAAGGPEVLADRYDEALARLAVRLPMLPEDHLVTVFDRWVLPLGESLATRMIELTVHLDDLAVSLGLPTPEIPDDAADVVVSALALIARRRRGTWPLVRGLSRRERQAGLITAF